MAYSEQSNAYIARKVQSGVGAQASGAGAVTLLTTGGQGGRMTKAATESRTVRPDMLSTRGRHGMRKTTGAYTCEPGIGTHDDIIEAIMRSTWGAPDLAITNTAMTSITTTANTIVAAAGSWIAQGLRVFDIIRLSGHSTVANNGRNLRIVGLTATVITVAETLIVDAVADASFSVTRVGRKITNPTSGLVKRYFTIEEYEVDLDGSEVFTDCMWGSMRWAMAPNGLITADPSWVGTGRFETMNGASAPFFTSPTVPVLNTMAALEATLRFGSTDMVDLTAFDLTLDITPNAPDVITPPTAPYSPAVFGGSLKVSMSLTMLRKDLLSVADFIAENPLSLNVVFAENEAAPQDFISITVPNFTLGSVDKSALSKEGGPRTQTIAVPAALVGVDDRGGAFDPGMIKFQVSNAA